MEGKVEDIIRRASSDFNLPERCFSSMTGMIIDDPPRSSSDLQDKLAYFLSDCTVEKDTVKLSSEIWKQLQEIDFKPLGDAEISSESTTSDLSEPVITPKALPVASIQEKSTKASKKRNNKEDSKETPALTNQRTYPPPRVYHNCGESKTRDIIVDGFSIMIGGKTLLDGANLKIAFARRYGLVGRNGIGKTSLLSAMASGEIEKLPKYLHILYVEQEVLGDEKTPMQSLLEADVEREELLKQQTEVTDDIEKMKEISDRLQEIDADTAESRAASILAGLGFTQDTMRQATSQLSGGWRMRLALAKGLFCEPDVLLLDEPTNHLDLETVVWLEGYLQDYPNTVIVVSHDRDFLNNVATDIIHFFSESLNYYKGNYQDFERVRGERNLNQKRTHDTQQARIEHVQKFIDRFRCNNKRASLVQSRIKALNKMELVEEVIDDPTCVFEFPETEQLSPPLLRIDEGSFGYRDELILSGININVDMDTRMAILGRNGCGKTTLLKIFEEELSVTSGQFFRHRRLRLATFTQHHIDQLNLSLTPLEQLMEMYPNTPSQNIRAHLSSFGISGPLALRTICYLSGGQKSRVAFAAVAFKQPHVLLLDEPTNHLDIDAVNALILAIEVYCGGVVVVSHDQHFVSSVCKELWVIKKGKVRQFKGDFKEYKEMISYS